MSLGTFDKCCVCMDLRIGSFIIGYLLLSWRLIQLIVASTSLSGIATALSGHQITLVHDDLEFIKLIICFEILILVFEILITVALLNGLHKKIQDQVQMFYVGGFVFEVLRLIIISVLLLRYVHLMVKTYGAWQWFSYSLEILCHVVDIYFLLTIRSYYYQMRKETTNQRWNVFADSRVQLQVTSHK